MTKGWFGNFKGHSDAWYKGRKLIRPIVGIGGSAAGGMVIGKDKKSAALAGFMNLGSEMNKREIEELRRKMGVKDNKVITDSLSSLTFGGGVNAVLGQFHHPLITIETMLRKKHNVKSGDVLVYRPTRGITAHELGHAKVLNTPMKKGLIVLHTQLGNLLYQNLAHRFNNPKHLKNFYYVLSAPTIASEAMASLAGYRGLSKTKKGVSTMEKLQLASSPLFYTKQIHKVGKIIGGEFEE